MIPSLSLTLASFLFDVTGAEPVRAQRGYVKPSGPFAFQSVCRISWCPVYTYFGKALRMVRPATGVYQCCRLLHKTLMTLPMLIAAKGDPKNTSMWSPMPYAAVTDLLRGAAG